MVNYWCPRGLMSPAGGWSWSWPGRRGRRLLAAAGGVLGLVLSLWPDFLGRLSYHVLTRRAILVYCRVSAHPMMKVKTR